MLYTTTRSLAVNAYISKGVMVSPLFLSSITANLSPPLDSKACANDRFFGNLILSKSTPSTVATAISFHASITRVLSLAKAAVARWGAYLR